MATPKNFKRPADGEVRRAALNVRLRAQAEQPNVLRAKKHSDEVTLIFSIDSFPGSLQRVLAVFKVRRSVLNAARSWCWRLLNCIDGHVPHITC